MNERILELAEQAIANVRFWNAEKESYDVGHDELEKFAELIVRECLCKIENEAAQYAEPAWAVELVNDIKEHFGVE